MTDFFRFWWALFALNSRKTVFRLRRGKGRCPCQSPSDTGKAWVTHCEEAAVWDKPARFRRVCPLYRPGPDGWRCSVDTENVRPFWGRAFSWTAGAAAGLYLCAALGAFIYLRSIGYDRLTPVDTLWPRRWENVALARSEYFLQRAKAALTAQDERAMRVSLASASAAATRHYEARLVLAQIHSYLSERQVASHAFADLLADFPAERERTAVAFHDALLSRRQFDLLADFALAQLAEKTGSHETVWLRAVVGALREVGAPEEALNRNAKSVARLPALWRDAVVAEAKLRGGDRSILGRWPEVPLTPENAALLILMGESMAEFAPATTAADDIIRMTPAIGEFERNRLLFRLNVRVGAHRQASQAADAMLRVAAKPAQRERLLALLIEFPQTDAIGRLAAAASNPRTPFTAAELGSLWVAAVAGNDANVRSLAVRRLQAHYNIEISESFPALFTATNAALWIRVLPLGRESVWALASQFSVRERDRRPSTR